MKRWRRKDERPADEDRYLNEDRVERLAGELLDQAYELAAAEPCGARKLDFVMPLARNTRG